MQSLLTIRRDGTAARSVDERWDRWAPGRQQSCRYADRMVLVQRIHCLCHGSWLVLHHMMREHAGQACLHNCTSRHDF